MQRVQVPKTVLFGKVPVPDMYIPFVNKLQYRNASKNLGED